MVAAVFVGLWAVGVTVSGQSIGWLVDQILLLTGLSQPAWGWPVVAVINAVLVGVPAGLLAALPRAQAVRAAGRAWLLGAVVLGLLGLLRALPERQHELYLAALALAAGLLALLIRRWFTGVDRRNSGPTAAPRAAGASAGNWFTIAGGLALLLPWVWLGALGGPLETVLAAASAAAVGALATVILSPGFWDCYGGPSPSKGRSGPVRLVLLGGLVAGVALLLIAAGMGQAGAQLPALLILPAAGFALAALWPLARYGSAKRRDVTYQPSTMTGSAPTAWLVGLAAFGPLAFVDPQEITLLLSDGLDVPFWTLVAAGGSLAVALLLGLGYGLTFARTRAVIPHRWLGAVAAGVLLVATTGVYVGLGQPGFHGERLFVVMRQQADLTGIPAGQPGPAGRDARVREVHRRLIETAERSQADLRRDLDRWHLRFTPYYLVNAVEVDGGPAVRAWLARRADVARVLLSQRLRPLPAEPTVSESGGTAPTAPAWNLTLIGADRVWSELGVTGAGIVVGSSDSGVQGSHPELAAGFRGGDDSWYDPWNGSRSPTDHGGHGTHTLATAVGKHVGVAPGAQWTGCVNLDRNLGNPAYYLDCLQFMFAPFPAGGDPFADGRPERAPHVLTNSWGCPPLEGCDQDALRPATAAFAAAGIFFAVAAGNTGPSCGSVDDPPAPYGDAFTVGAVDRQRRVTDFSSRGPTPDGLRKPDLVAPGARVLSAMPGGGYATMDGTSMATPHVAGVVALMWSADPALIGDLDRTRQLLRDTAAPAVTSPDGCGSTENVVGAGLVDAYAAVRAARG